MQDKLAKRGLNSRSFTVMFADWYKFAFTTVFVLFFLSEKNHLLFRVITSAAMDIVFENGNNVMVSITV